MPTVKGKNEWFFKLFIKKTDGTGVYTAGLFSIRPPRVLGITFLVLGIVALLCFPGYGVVSAALSFGLLHIVFGLYILRKQRQTVVV